MNIKLKHFVTEIEIAYNDKGVLEHITNLSTGKHMMLETFQVGSGYEIEREGFMGMNVCNATYVRIIELDLYVPRLIFINPKVDL